MKGNKKGNQTINENKVKEEIPKLRKSDESRKNISAEPSAAELQHRKNMFPKIEDVLKNKNTRCTICRKDLLTQLRDGKDMYSHPYLKVLICKECSSFYGDGEFSVDEDGSDKYCRWCGQGGILYCCTECSYTFCKKCVKCNLGRSVMAEMEDDDWKCFVCNIAPLWDLRAICDTAQKLATSKQQLKQTQQIKKSRGKKKSSSSESEEEYEKVTKTKRSRSSSAESGKGKPEGSTNKRTVTLRNKRKRTESSDVEESNKKKINHESESESDSFRMQAETNSKKKFNPKDPHAWLKGHCETLIDISGMIKTKADRIIKKKISKSALKNKDNVEQVCQYITELAKTAKESIDLLQDHAEFHLKVWNGELADENKNTPAENQDNEKIDEIEENKEEKTISVEGELEEEPEEKVNKELNKDEAEPDELEVSTKENDMANESKQEEGDETIKSVPESEDEEIVVKKDKESGNSEVKEKVNGEMEVEEEGNENDVNNSDKKENSEDKKSTENSNIDKNE